MTKPDREQTRKYYDTEAERYDDVRYGSPHGRRVDAFHKAVLDRFIGSQLRGGENILELGCGTGRLLEHFSQYEVSLSGVDNSDGMLAVCRERFSKVECSPSLFVANAESLGFEKSSFDFVYSILVINLLQSFPEVFKEIARVLKPGGSFVFNVPNLQSIYFPGGMYVNSRGRTVGSNDAGYRYSHWFSRKEWEQALAAAGFGTFEVIGQPIISRFGRGAPRPYESNVGMLFSKSVYISASLRK